MNRILRTSLGLARAFSSKAGAAASEASHQPPKKIPGHVGRYAGALFTAASKANLLEKVEGELQAVTQTMKAIPNFASFLENPTVAKDAKTKRIGELIEEGKFSHLSRNLVLTLAANGRVGEIRKVVDAFTDMMETSRGVVNVKIISAEELNKKSLETIESAVISMAGTGKKVRLEKKIDPTILGGLQIQMGERFLDLSVASRVSRLSADLDGAA